MAGWRAGPRPMAVVGLIAAFAAVAVGIAPSGTGFALPGPVETTANQGLWLRESAAGGVLRGLELRRCSHQLYLRGAGDDDDEADAEEGGNEEGEMEDAEAEEDEDDPDAGPMTITKAIRQVRRRGCYLPIGRQIRKRLALELTQSHACRSSITRGTTMGWPKVSRKFAKRWSAVRPS